MRAGVRQSDATITVAGSQGHFELNVYKPVMAYDDAAVDPAARRRRALASPTIASSASSANEARIRELMERSLMLVTALAPKIGYDNAAKIAKTAHTNGTTLREEAIGGGLRHRGGVRPAGPPGEDDSPRLTGRRPWNFGSNYLRVPHVAAVNSQTCYVKIEEATCKSAYVDDFRRARSASSDTRMARRHTMISTTPEVILQKFIA